MRSGVWGVLRDSGVVRVLVYSLVRSEWLDAG